MSQTGDYDIANASGSTVREDINNTLINVLTANSGGSAPSYKQTGTVWLNTTASRFEYYTGSAWHPFLHTNGSGVFQTGNSFIGLTATGSIEMQSDNGPVHIDFKRSAVDYDCRISQSNDTNYNFVIETGGNGNTKNTLTCNGNGSITLGDANSASAEIGVINGRGFASRSGYGGTNQGNVVNIQWTGTAAKLWIDSADQGTITVSSDYRVKKNITTQTASGIDKIKQLRPVNYEYADNDDFSFKADGVAREGFIAHEVAEVIPSGCEGAKDATNQVQSLKVDAIVSVLTKALQEAVAKIETLETKVAALEAK
mgnify:CR=1 FL=1|tara:strand:- start:564 stop:1502 length:939 start_codon:yes stop_codon:yes gene_type:complete